MGALIDLTGRHFGRLEVVARAGSRVRVGRTDALWLCRCKCNKEVVVLGMNLLHHNTQSCGCLAAEIHSQTMKKLNQRRWGCHVPTATPEGSPEDRVHQ